MRTSSHAVQAVPNVTPMIDVMLVLLVIFMVAAPANAMDVASKSGVAVVGMITERPAMKAPDARP